MANEALAERAPQPPEGDRGRRLWNAQQNRILRSILLDILNVAKKSPYITESRKTTRLHHEVKTTMRNNHVEVSKMLHDATRLQPPFCRDRCGNQIADAIDSLVDFPTGMHLARSLVEAYEKGGDVSLDDALSPTIRAFCEVLFADAPVQAVAPMPPPWASAAHPGSSDSCVPRCL